MERTWQTVEPLPRRDERGKASNDSVIVVNVNAAFQRPLRSNQHRQTQCPVLEKKKINVSSSPTLRGNNTTQQLSIYTKK